jgi:hypothetical protein
MVEVKKILNLLQFTEANESDIDQGVCRFLTDFDYKALKLKENLQDEIKGCKTDEKCEENLPAICFRADVWRDKDER